MCSTHVIVTDCSVQSIVHYAFIHCCNFLSLLLRFLADSCKMFKFITVITFISLCSSGLRLIELAHVSFLLHSWSLLTVLLDCIKIHWVFFTSWGELFFSYSQSTVRTHLLHSLFSLLTVNVDEDIYHLLKFLRTLSSYYLIFNSLIELSIVLWY